MLIPLSFSVGPSLTAAVGANIGAEQYTRARRIAWSGAAVTFVFTGAMGTKVAPTPGLWLDVFTGEVGPYNYAASLPCDCRPFLCAVRDEQALYFASQGTGSIVFSVMASSIRFFTVLGLSSLAVLAGCDV